MVDTTSQTSWAVKSYLDVREIAEQDGSILVIPTGSIEQHGPHLPTSTDTLLATAVARESTEQVADDVPVLVSPPVWSGFSPHHMAFGGTITLDSETLLSLLEDVANSALENEFDALLFVNGHGGNASPLGIAVSNIGQANPECEILSVTYSQLAGPFIDDIRDSELGGMFHAGELETSLMLYLHPELVDEPNLEGTVPDHDERYRHRGKDMFEGGPLTIYSPSHETAETGATGDPSVATREKGEQSFELLCEELGGLLREIHAKNN